MQSAQIVTSTKNITIIFRMFKSKDSVKGIYVTTKDIR
jgi:hypothetical protein